jgi:hypothetical protein
MAAPNIVGVTTIVGITTVVALTTGSSTILSNPANSNSVYKINTILAGNKTGSTASVSVYYNSVAAGAGTTFTIANSVDVITKSSLAVLDKTTTFYLEENKSITALSSANSSIDLIVSYEIIQ